MTYFTVLSSVKHPWYQKVSVGSRINYNHKISQQCMSNVSIQSNVHSTQFLSLRILEMSENIF